MSNVSAAPAVSVVIPLYNAQDVIRETLKTVLNQTWKDYEIVVVDDGSNDGSGHIVQEFGDKVRYVRQENGGVAKARNRGIAESRGRYIALLDHDDLWEPTKLEKQIAVLESRAEVGLVITQVKHLDRDGQQIGQIARAYNSADRFYQLFVKGYVPTPSSAMIRKAVLDVAGGFDEAFRSAGLDDHELWPRIAAITEIASVDEPLTFHRNRWVKPTEIALEHRAILIERLRALCRQDGRKKRYLALEEARYCADLGRHLVEERRYREGRSLLVRGLRLSLTDARSFHVAWRCMQRIVRSYL